VLIFSNLLGERRVAQRRRRDARRSFLG